MFHKAETHDVLGHELYEQLRREPPPLDTGSCYDPSTSAVTRGVPVGGVPFAESFDDVLARVMPLWEGEIAPAAERGKTVLAITSKNCLRALFLAITDMPREARSARDRPEIGLRSIRDRPEIDPRSIRDRPEIDPRSTERSTRDRPEIDPRSTEIGMSPMRRRTSSTSIFRTACRCCTPHARARSRALIPALLSLILSLSYCREPCAQSRSPADAVNNV